MLCGEFCKSPHPLLIHMPWLQPLKQVHAAPSAIFCGSCSSCGVKVAQRCGVSTLAFPGVWLELIPFCEACHMPPENVSINPVTIAEVSAISPLLSLTLLVYLCPLAKFPNNSTITVVSLWLKKSSLGLAVIDHLAGTRHFLFLSHF